MHEEFHQEGAGALQVFLLEAEVEVFDIDDAVEGQVLGAVGVELRKGHPQGSTVAQPPVWRVTFGVRT